MASCGEVCFIAHSVTLSRPSLVHGMTEGASGHELAAAKAVQATSRRKIDDLMVGDESGVMFGSSQCNNVISDTTTCVEVHVDLD